MSADMDTEKLRNHKRYYAMLVFTSSCQTYVLYVDALIDDYWYIVKP